MSKKLDRELDSRLFLNYCPLKTRIAIERERRKDILRLLVMFIWPIVACAVLIAFLSRNGGFIALFEAYEPWSGPLLYIICGPGIVVPLVYLMTEPTYFFTWPRPLSWVDDAVSDKELSTVCLAYPELNDYRGKVVELGRRLTWEEYQKMKTWPENKGKQIEHRALRRSYGLRDFLHFKEMSDE